MPQTDGHHADKEIVRDIANQLDGGAGRRPDVERDILRTIAELRLICGSESSRNPPTSGWERDNRDYLQSVHTQTDKLWKILSSPPEGVGTRLLLALFAPAEFIAANTKDLSDDERMLLMTAACNAMLRRRERIEAALASLRDRCEPLLAESKLGMHRHFDYPKRQAAVAARRIMERWGKPVTWSSAQSPYALIADALCRAIEEEPTGMERILKDVRDMNLT